MASAQLKVFPKPAAVAATPLHDGTNTQGYPPQVKGFLIQALSDVHFGDENVAGESNAFTVEKGNQAALEGFLSRGTYESYELRQIYHIGGAFKLVLELEANAEE